MGAEVKDNEKFCSNCGASLSISAIDKKYEKNGNDSSSFSTSEDDKGNDSSSFSTSEDEKLEIKENKPPKKKDMGIAIIISIILSGLGVAYAGNTKKGIIIFIAFIISLILGIGLIVWIYGLYATYIEVNHVNNSENNEFIERIRGLSRIQKIAIFLVILLVFSGASSFVSLVNDDSGNGGKNNSNNGSDVKSDSNSGNNNDTDKKSDSNKNKEMNEEQYKGNCTTLDYGILQKNPNKHFGEKLSYSGKVFQISEDRSGGYLLLAVNDDSSQLIYVSYEGNNNFVENDHITVYGECYGDYSYKTKIGGQNNVPWIKAKYIQ